MCSICNQTAHFSVLNSWTSYLSSAQIHEQGWCRNMLPMWKCLYQTSCLNKFNKDSFNFFPFLFISASLQEKKL
jgi:hypothetical protein